MPLIVTGNPVEIRDMDGFPSKNGFSIEARVSATGRPVLVNISYEAIQDYGFDRAQNVASDKYDRGRIERDGSVNVYTSECA